MIFRGPRVAAAELERVTGWRLKPEGLCRDGRCVPFPTVSTEAVDLDDVSRALEMPLVGEARAGLWALGFEAGERALVSATLPELELGSGTSTRCVIGPLTARPAVTRCRPTRSFAVAGRAP